MCTLKNFIYLHIKNSKGTTTKTLNFPFYTTSFSLVVVLNGILKYLSIYFIFSKYTCQIGREIVDYNFFNSKMLIKYIIDEVPISPFASERF
jgi:hypothetical protein